MTVFYRALMLIGLLFFSWSSAMASFCTTYAGTGACVSLTGTSVNHIALAASAVFEVNSGKLGITLVNDAASSASQLGGAEILTAVLFNLNGAGTLTKTGSTAAFASPLGITGVLSPSGSTDNPGQNWALATSSNYFANQNSITSTGLSGPVGGKGNLSGCTTNVNPSTDCRVLGSPGWGVSPASNAGGFAPGVSPLINHSIYFSLAGLTNGLTNTQLKADLSHVVFQYGTGSTDATCLGCATPVPEPSHIAFLILASCLAISVHQRKQRST